MPTPGRLRSSAGPLLAILAALAGGACVESPSLGGAPDNAAVAVIPSATPLAPLDRTAVPTASARPLTEPGCCARHWWSAEGDRVLFIDDPEGDLPLGIYAVSPQGSDVHLASTSVTGADLPPGDAPPDLSPTLGPDYRLPADAQNIRLSPDGVKVAWSVGSTLPVNVDRRQRSLWVVGGPLDVRRRLVVLTGGDLIGWAADGQSLVATGRIPESGPTGIWRVPVDGGAPTLLAPGDRPRGTRLSPSARWLAFYLAFETEPARSGLWVLGTAGEAARLLPAFGSYRWGANDRLYFIPYDGEAQELSLATFDPATGTTEVVRSDEAFPGGIAVNDWSVSPDGVWIVYRSAQDGALWIVPAGGG